MFQVDVRIPRTCMIWLPTGGRWEATTQPYLNTSSNMGTERSAWEKYSILVSYQTNVVKSQNFNEYKSVFYDHLSLTTKINGVKGWP